MAAKKAKKVVKKSKKGVLKAMQEGRSPSAQKGKLSLLVPPKGKHVCEFC